MTIQPGSNAVAEFAGQFFNAGFIAIEYPVIGEVGKTKPAPVEVINHQVKHSRAASTRHLVKEA